MDPLRKMRLGLHAVFILVVAIVIRYRPELSQAAQAQALWRLRFTTMAKQYQPILATTAAKKKRRHRENPSPRLRPLRRLAQFW